MSPEQAATEVRTIPDRAATERRRPPDNFGTRVISLREEQGRPFRPALLMLTAATGLVLLMACANVAGLLLARGESCGGGSWPFAERSVRGASRIVRQLLTESVVLSVGGGAAGLAVTAAIMGAAPTLVPRSVPGLADAGIDGTVLRLRRQETVSEAWGRTRRRRYWPQGKWRSPSCS